MRLCLSTVGYGRALTKAIRFADREDVMAGAAASDGTVGKALDVLDQVAAFGRPVRFSELDVVER